MQPIGTIWNSASTTLLNFELAIVVLAAIAVIDSRRVFGHLLYHFKDFVSVFHFRLTSFLEEKLSLHPQKSDESIMLPTQIQSPVHPYYSTFYVP